MASQSLATLPVDLTALDGSEDALAALAEQASLQKLPEIAAATNAKTQELLDSETGEEILGTSSNF
jgi:hypothetical protein